MTVFIWKSILIFFATALSDLVWTMWILHTTSLNRWRSSAYSSAIILLGGLTVVSYVSDKRLLVPAAIGAFVGTFITLTAHQREQHKKEHNVSPQNGSQG